MSLKKPTKLLRMILSFSPLTLICIDRFTSHLPVVILSVVKMPGQSFLDFVRASSPLPPFLPMPLIRLSRSRAANPHQGRLSVSRGPFIFRAPASSREGLREGRMCFKRLVSPFRTKCDLLFWVRCYASEPAQGADYQQEYLHVLTPPHELIVIISSRRRLEVAQSLFLGPSCRKQRLQDSRYMGLLEPQDDPTS